VFEEPCDAGAVEDEIRATVSDFADSSGLDDPMNIDIIGACLGTGTELRVTAIVPTTTWRSALAGLAPPST
jgi:hypothetical protein